MTEKIKGLLAAPFTPLTPEGDIHTQLIPAYAALLKNNGICGVFVNGSSGEGYLLTEQERITLAEAWIREATPAFKVMVHVGSTCVEESRHLAAHAQSAGAWAIGTMAPPFPPIATLEELVKYCEQIAAAAPQLPFYFYHIPVFNHVIFPMVDFLKAVDGRIPNFAGIKYTYDNLYEFNQCTLYKDGRFDLLHGLDETLLASLALCNTQGGISGTANYIGNILTGVMDCWKKGDTEGARRYQNYAQEVINVICHFRGNIVGGKHIMKLLGLDMGPNRTPFRDMSAEEEKLMKQELDAIHFMDHCNRR